MPVASPGAELQKSCWEEGRFTHTTVVAERLDQTALTSEAQPGTCGVAPTVKKQQLQAATLRVSCVRGSVLIWLSRWGTLRLQASRKIALVTQGRAGAESCSCPSRSWPGASTAAVEFY